MCACVHVASLKHNLRQFSSFVISLQTEIAFYARFFFFRFSHVFDAIRGDSRFFTRDFLVATAKNLLPKKSEWIAWGQYENVVIELRFKVMRKVKFVDCLGGSQLH